MRILLSGLVLLVVACAEDPDFSATEFSVRVIDPGTRPGRELTYEFPDDDWPTLHVVVEVDATWTAGDRVNQPAPPLRERFPVEIRTRPRPEGGAVATVTVGVPVRKFEGCREFAGEIRWDARGRVEEFDLHVPEGTPPAARAMQKALLDRLGRVLPPLPEGRVGAGARWKVIRPGDATRPNTVVLACRLVQLREDAMRISYRARGATPAGSGGATSLRSSKVTGEGTTALSLPSFYVTGEEKFTLTEVHSADDGDKHQRVTRVLRVRTSIAD